MTNQDAKAQERRAKLEALGESFTVADVAEALTTTGLEARTYLDKLLEAGRVTIVGERANEGGRPSTLYALAK